jgi:Concanavalin A-like lectin/glucanases superfamily
MKKLRFPPSDPSVRKVSLSVSAAALMLGASHAATVGFNFQCNYCDNYAFSGAVVTASAFGVGTNAWENLSPMSTGIGCPASYVTLTQVLDTNSTGPGLNPIPRGSVTVAWSAYTANVSEFGGYSRPGPNYSFTNNAIQPGAEQVYWGFLRDGVNPDFADSVGQVEPGYVVDLHGLKSLFPNSPFAIQLIGASDSMQYLTNAFIIDVTADTTQSVVYPSTPPVADLDMFPWVSGYGGGLSTASGALDTDHIQIIGNAASNGGDKTQGTDYNWASSIAGFIVTDQPVVTMSPQSVIAFAGDSPVSLSAYAVGVPPLSYQWRRNGVNVPGATTLSCVFTNLTHGISGTYDLVVTNFYGKGISSPASLAVDQIVASRTRNLVVDSSPAGGHDGMDLGAAWVATNTDTANVNRAGVMQFAAANTNQIVVPGETNFDSSIGTLMFWMRSAGLLNSSTTNPAPIFSRSGVDGLQVLQNPDGTIAVLTTLSGSSPFTGPGPSLSDNLWHHVAVVYDQTNLMTMAVYVDGQPYASDTNMPAWTWPAGQPFELGYTQDPSLQPFNGLVDDVRFYHTVLSDSDIAAVFASDAVVQPAGLVLRLNFDAPPANGLILQWLCPDAILQSADSLKGPFTDLPGAVSPFPTAEQKAIKFYRYRGHTPSAVTSNPYLM